MLNLFSTDDHVIEHPEVWSSRVPAKYLATAPHIVEEDGKQFWEYEDMRAPTVGLAAAVGRPPEEWSSDPVTFDAMRQGCYDSRARAVDFASNGIVASISFPTLPRFAGVLFNQFKDKDLADICVQSYNDFILDEWCPNGPPGLYVPTIISQLWDPELAAKEVRRCASLGAKALSFPENTAPLGLPSYWTSHWDPVWDAVQETDVAVLMHIGTSGEFPNPSPEAPPSLGFALLPTGSYTASVNLMWSPVCRKFPKTKFVFAEGGIGWVPGALELSDRKWKTDKPYMGFDDTLPSEIFRRNMWVCMIDEPIALGYRDLIGVDRILWECDYPHPDSIWPRCQETAVACFEASGCSQSEIEMISHLNAEHLFNWESAKPVEESSIK